MTKNVIRFPLEKALRRGEIVCGPSATIVVLPVVRVERGGTIKPKPKRKPTRKWNR